MCLARARQVLDTCTVGDMTLSNPVVTCGTGVLCLSADSPGHDVWAPTNVPAYDTGGLSGARLCLQFCRHSLPLTGRLSSGCLRSQWQGRRRTRRPRLPVNPPLGREEDVMIEDLTGESSVPAT